MKFSLSHIPGTIARGVLSVMYPPRCQACGRGMDLFSGKVLCEKCGDDIKSNACSETGLCGPSARYFEAFYSACLYEGALRECVHNFKYNGRRGIVSLFGSLMAEFAEKHIAMDRFDWLAPVPLHRTKYRERTFNQSQALAARLSRRFKIPLSANNLVRVRAGRPQMTLPRNKRPQEVTGAFRIRNSSLIKDKTILLIDDVFTTGATVNECAKVMKAAGAGTVEAFVLARGAQP